MRRKHIIPLVFLAAGICHGQNIRTGTSIQPVADDANNRYCWNSAVATPKPVPVLAIGSFDWATAPPSPSIATLSLLAAAGALLACIGCFWLGRSSRAREIEELRNELPRRNARGQYARRNPEPHGA